MSRHPIIREDIFFEVKTNTAGTVKGRLSFTDGSKLEFAEYVVISGGKVNKVRYRYTWLLEDAVLTRWDNAPHHPELETYPHHKHEAERVWKCSEPSLASILDNIEKKLTSARTD
nr:DUF6516 family protein [Candidatus Freyarchaeota archaeon]